MILALSDIAAGLGLPVFPCDAEKRPIVAGGFKTASLDPSHIRAAFERGRAALIGMPTGKASGLVVIDIDIRPNHSGMAWLDENADALPQTRTHKTRSGGLHLVFLNPEGIEIRNSASRIAPGVDVRGEGGYVIIPPSDGYAVADPCEPAEMPRWLIRACMKEERQHTETSRSKSAPRQDGGTPYGLKALANECDEIRSASFGKQEIALNEAALKIGALVAGGELQEGIARADLMAAGRGMANEGGREPWTDEEIEAKIRRGMKDGAGRPRSAPVRVERETLSEPPPEEPDAYWKSLERDIQMWNEEPVHEPAEHEELKAPALWSTDATWNEAEIPRRPWIAKPYLMRRSVSVVAGMGSAGKSMLSVGWAAALALSVRWSRFQAAAPCRVSLYNVEDDDAEQKLRLSATLKQFRADPAQLAGRLYRLGPHNIGTLIERDPLTNKLRLTDVMVELIEHVEKVRPDVLILDPLVELHNADENDNTALRGIIATLRAIAVKYDLAIALIHHARKGSAAAAGDPDMIRGAGAIVGAARAALTVSTMTEEEAEELRIPKHMRFDYFRLDNAKQNYARIGEAEWFHRVAYTLANGEEVAAAEPWKAPSTLQTAGQDELDRIFDEIDKGPEDGVLYASTRRGNGAKRWVGYLLKSRLGGSEEQAKSKVDAWLRQGVLVETEFTDPRRREKASGVKVDRSKVQK